MGLLVPASSDSQAHFLNDWCQKITCTTGRIANLTIAQGIRKDTGKHQFDYVDRGINLAVVFLIVRIQQINAIRIRTAQAFGFLFSVGHFSLSRIIRTVSRAI